MLDLSELSVKENDYISTIEMSNELKDKFPKDSTRFMQKFSVGGQQRFGRAVSLSLQSDEWRRTSRCCKLDERSTQKLPRSERCIR